VPKIRAGELGVNVQRLPAEGAGPDAPVVVFVHGLLTDSLASYYFTVGPAFAAAGYEVVMYDLRGHGRSDRPTDGYRLEGFVEDLANLLTALDITAPVHVVGNSFGGTVATAFAAWHPERVATVIMIESEPPLPVWCEHMRDGLLDAKTRLPRPQVIDWVRENKGAHTAKLSQNANRILQSTTIADDVPASRTIAALTDIGRPLLGIFGAESGLAVQQDDLAALPGSRVVIIPEQGHSVLIERTDDVREALLKWLAEHR
jgi:pimeloyl-ACP methyl ester carboxylesterase